MSRRRLPRRLPAAFASAAVLLFAGAAFAQPGVPSQRNGDATARTTIGAPNAHACNEAAASGDASEGAITNCTRAIEEERLSRINVISTRINRGAIHLRRREGAAALADFDAVIAMDRRNPEAYVNRGAALIMIGRPGPAVGAITEALTLGVREPHKAYYNRGAAREALGDLRGAYEDYSTALQIEPDWGPAGQELARFVRMRRERLASVVGASTLAPPVGSGAETESAP